MEKIYFGTSSGNRKAQNIIDFEGGFEKEAFRRILKHSRLAEEKKIYMKVSTALPRKRKCSNHEPEEREY